MNILQILARMIFRAAVLIFVILNFEPSAVWSIPVGILVAFCSEAKNLTKTKI